MRRNAQGVLQLRQHEHDACNSHHCLNLPCNKFLPYITCFPTCIPTSTTEPFQAKVERDTYSWQYKGIDNLGMQRACSEHHECVTKSKGSVGRWNLNFWRLSRAILHKFLKQGCCRHLFLSHRLIQNKQRNNCEATQNDGEKSSCIF